MKICSGWGFNYTAFTGKLSELRLSFLLCNHITYRRIFWQSMSILNFLPIFGKNTKAIVHGFVKNWAFQVGHGIKPIYVSMYVYMSWNCIANLTIKASLVFVKLWICMLTHFWKKYQGYSSWFCQKLGYTQYIYTCVFVYLVCHLHV